MDKVYSFTDLIVWKKAHAFVLHIYKLSDSFPTSEQYGLKDQKRRAAVSVTSNIAEGFYRRTQTDKCYFYYVSLGSLGEIQSQIFIARDLCYIQGNDSDSILKTITEVRRLLMGLLRSSSTKPTRPYSS